MHKIRRSWGSPLRLKAQKLEVPVNNFSITELTSKNNVPVIIIIVFLNLPLVKMCIWLTIEKKKRLILFLMLIKFSL